MWYLKLCKGLNIVDGVMIIPFQLQLQPEFPSIPGFTLSTMKVTHAAIMFFCVSLISL